jgi:hypothetical protein
MENSAEVIPAFTVMPGYLRTICVKNIKQLATTSPCPHIVQIV